MENSARKHQSDLQSLRDISRNPHAVSEIFDRHRKTLRKIIAYRLHARLRSRIDPSDVVQETLTEAYRRLPEFLEDPKVSLSTWLRFLAFHKVAQVHQANFGVQARDVRREFSLQDCPIPEMSSAEIAAQLVGRIETPVQTALKEELHRALHQVLDEMSDLDREVLVRRHFDQLKNHEIAEELGIDEGTASKRYYRALARIKSKIHSLTNDALDLFQ